MEQEIKVTHGNSSTRFSTAQVAAFPTFEAFATAKAHMLSYVHDQKLRVKMLKDVYAQAKGEQPAEETKKADTAITSKQDKGAK